MNIGQVLQNILTIIKTDSGKALLTPIINLLTAVKTNGDPIQVAAAAAKFQVDILVLLPSLEISVIQDIAATVLAEVQALVPKA